MKRKTVKKTVVYFSDKKYTSQGWIAISSKEKEN
jgi:hypothetical protein